MEDMNAADECSDALQSPRPPLLRLSWTVCQTKSDGSMHMLSEKVWQTSSSNKCNPSSATEGGVHLAIWTIRQNPPHFCSNRATWESTEPTSFSSATKLEAFLFSPQWTWHKRLGLQLAPLRFQNSVHLIFSSHQERLYCSFTEQFTFGSIDKETQWRTKLFNNAECF